MASSPSPLMDELVEEVLLRLPPDRPASLVHAGLVCKRRCHLVSDPSFWRRFREFHRSPPMLGFLYSYHSADQGRNTRFVPTTTVSALRRADHRVFWADSRHGRVLLYCNGSYSYCSSCGVSCIVVWDPIADEWLELPSPPLSLDSLTAAVLCASSACDHTDCHRVPFDVVMVGTRGARVFSCVYSSSKAAWGEPASAPHSGGAITGTHSALVGAALYFVFHGGERILEYDLPTRATSVIHLPRAQKSLSFKLFGPTELTTTEDGRLGFARVVKSRLCLWSRYDAGWTLSKAIDLEKVLPIRGPWNDRPCLVGSAGGAALYS